jgi:hypothetical protein
MLIPLGTPSSRVTDREALNTDLQNMLRRWGLDPAAYEGKAGEVRKALQRVKREHAARFGFDTAGLSDDQLTDDHQYTIFPNVVLNVHAEGVTLFRHRPHPTDPDRMFWDLQRYVHMGSERPLRAPHTHHCQGEVSLGQILDQDLYTLPHVQRGMKSRGYAGAWIGEQELRIRHFHDVLLRYVGGDVDP